MGKEIRQWIVSTHSRLKAAGGAGGRGRPRPTIVSTHSRLKAAGWTRYTPIIDFKGFNTQPPEGGWGCTLCVDCQEDLVSTHSRLKAAGVYYRAVFNSLFVSTHSRLKAAGHLLIKIAKSSPVSTHSRLKAAGARRAVFFCAGAFQHTAA